MKKRGLYYIGLLVISVILIFVFIGCALTSYACEIVEKNSLEIEVKNEAVKSNTITINNIQYTVNYSSSVKSVLTNVYYDVYEVIDNTSNIAKSKIRIDSATGEISSFSNISPYSQIDNINSLSDDEIKSVVEELMGNEVCFSEYNIFNLARPHSSTSMYYLVWQVKQDILCNNKVEIYITTEGTIKSFYKTDACPTNLAKSFIDNEERDKLLENKICEYLGVEAIDGIEYEIDSETLSYYNSNPAILYSVSIVNNGFVELISIVIY